MLSLLKSVLNSDATVIASDQNGVVAIEKPINVLSVPNEGGASQKSILIGRYHEQHRYYELPGGGRFFLLNRLDSPTSGVLIGCFDLEVANSIRDEFSKKRVRKHYCAVTQFQKISKQGVWKDFLDKKKECGVVRVFAGDGECAMTRYFIQSEIAISRQQLLLLDLSPITGRTHQLRVQCSVRHLAILGDRTYGNFSLNKSVFGALPLDKRRLFLHSKSIAFEYAIKGKIFNFSAQSQCPFENAAYFR